MKFFLTSKYGAKNRQLCYLLMMAFAIKTPSFGAATAMTNFDDPLTSAKSSFMIVTKNDETNHAAISNQNGIHMKEERRAEEIGIPLVGCEEHLLPRETLGAPIPFPEGSLEVASYDGDDILALVKVDGWNRADISKMWINHIGVLGDYSCFPTPPGSGLGVPPDTMIEFVATCTEGLTDIAIFMHTGNEYNLGDGGHTNGCDAFNSNRTGTTGYYFTIPCDGANCKTAAPTSAPTDCEEHVILPQETSGAPVLFPEEALDVVKYNGGFRGQCYIGYRCMGRHVN